MAYGPWSASTSSVPPSSAPTPHQTNRRPRRLRGPSGHSSSSTQAPPNATASPANAITRPTASSPPTAALTPRCAVSTTALGVPIENENAPATGCESADTTRQATT